MQVNDTVLAILSQAETRGNALVLPGQLDRKMYEQVNKVLDAAGGTWNRKAKAHLFTGDAAERVDQIILTGKVDIPKDEFNYFPTPPEVVARLLELAGVQPGMRVLEPEAGQGAIAFPCAQAGATVDCYELMEANYKTLAGTTGLGDVRHMDFLAATPRAIYDRVVMNPPFAKQADIKHVLHALRFLKPGGKLVAVMSAGVAFRDNALTREFRELVQKAGGYMEALPEGAFKSSGTMVRTVLVVIPDRSSPDAWHPQARQ